jgi:exopolysaccharide biosynthesis protein
MSFSEDKNNESNIEAKVKRKVSKKGIFFFLIFELIFTLITVPFMAYYGPFNNVKTTLVTSAMTTYKSQYLATLFLPKSEIDKIMNGQKIDTIQQKNLNKVEIDPTKHDVSIERKEISGTKFKGYALIIHDATRVKVGYTKNLGKSGETTSQIAKDNNAVAAINGGGFNDKTNGEWVGTGGKPIGILMAGGKLISPALSSINKDEAGDIVALTKTGKLLVGPYSYNQLTQNEVMEAISFNPALVVDGEPTIKTGDGGWGIASRTAIGQKQDGSIILLVIDGRQLGSVGATLKEVQDTMLELGAINAGNLDGGSSTTMYYNGEIINNPSDTVGERAIPSAIYVK